MRIDRAAKQKKTPTPLHTTLPSFHLQPTLPFQSALSTSSPKTISPEHHLNHTIFPLRLEEFALVVNNNKRSCRISIRVTLDPSIQISRTIQGIESVPFHLCQHP